ncbi:2867_t:CDS:2, partial [Racocetra fulgida]
LMELDFDLVNLSDDIDFKKVLFKNKAVVVTAKEDISRIVDEFIWNIENRIETYIPSQYYCLIQEKEELEKLEEYTTKHNGSDGKTKVSVKIRGNDFAREFIKAIEKEVVQCQNFLAGDYITSINIFQSWELGKINLNFSKEYEKLIHLKHYLKVFVICNLQLRIKPEEFKLLIHFHNLDKFDAHLIFQAMRQVSKEKISAILYNMESYFILDIGNQRYIDSLQLISGYLDSHISNLRAELYKEDVNKDGNSLNLPCKKPNHLYRIDSNRCFAHPERFPITRKYGSKGRNDLVFHKAPFPYDWFNTPEKMNATSFPSIEAFGNYHDFYLNLNILLLADCLEGFRKLMKGRFGLDIAHYVSLTSFAENALYKTTGQEIKLFTDNNIYLFSNNLQYPDFVSKSEEIPDNAEKSYILEVDLDYSYKLHKAYTSYSLASENIKISKEKI